MTDRDVAARVSEQPQPRAQAAPMGPEQVRGLRGTQSRAAFARRLGVTPHTVYRWELPDGAREARRPRGAELARLALLEARAEHLASARLDVLMLPGVARAQPKAVAPRAALPAEEASVILPALERLYCGEGRQVLLDLVHLSVQRQDLSADGRALSRFGIAVAEIFQRSDTRAALLAVTPALADVDAEEISRHVEVRILGIAALIHALPDAASYDLGRVHAYAARVWSRSRPSELEGRALACLALLWAAAVSGDRDLIERAYARLDESALIDLPPLLELHLDEFRTLRPELYGKTGTCLRGLELIVERAEQLDCPALEARARSHLALRMLDNLCDPELALALARRARQIGKQPPIAPGMHVVCAARAELDALVRVGRLDEAFTVFEELDSWSRETGFLPLSAVPSRACLLFLTGQHAALNELATSLRSCEVAALAPISCAYATATEAIAACCSSEYALSSVAALEEAEALAARWPHLFRFVILHRVVAHMMAGQNDAAQLALWRAQRFADAFPSAWLGAHLRRLEGCLLAARGQWAEGRRLLESALATFELGRDVCDAALVRHLLAAVGKEFGEPGADTNVTRRVLADLGITAPRSIDIGLAHFREALHRQPCILSPREPFRAADLVVPVRRLAAHGMAPPLILRELASIATELFPDRTVQLDEVESTGVARTLAGATQGPTSQEWTEFGTGSGRLFRIGVSGTLGDDERAALSLLATTASLALEAATLRGVHDAFESAAAEDKSPEIPGFIAASPEMRKLRAEIVRLSESRATVIITGESGAGKEVVARAIHAVSERASKPYVPFNCAAVPRDLFEGQLFGYRRGSFTGALADHVGVLRAASSGTIFLDEIAELPLDVQPKLLRFLENGEVFPLGEHRPMRVDVRVIAATHRDLSELVRAGRFREDLYYRLQVVPLHLPPLRARREDIPVLARHFVREMMRHRDPPVLAPDALASLTAHPWRGNVRELRNVIERALAFSPVPDVLQAKHLRLGISDPRAA